MLAISTIPLLADPRGAPLGRRLLLGVRTRDGGRAEV